MSGIGVGAAEAESSRDKAVATKVGNSIVGLKFDNVLNAIAVRWSPEDECRTQARNRRAVVLVVSWRVGSAV